MTTTLRDQKKWKTFYAGGQIAGLQEKTKSSFDVELPSGKLFDLEAAAKVGDKSPYVNDFDLGDPVEWYVALAAFGTEGVFTPMPIAPGRDVLSYLTGFLISQKASPKDRDRVVRFLCSQIQDLKRIRKALFSTHGASLACLE